MIQDVYIASALRTPIGSFGGALSQVTAPDLGAIVIRNCLESIGLQPELVEEIYFGNVCSANLGQAPARQAAVKAGLPYQVCCTTINKVCASGMKAVMLAAQSIQLGYRDIIIAGGMESMSNVPYYLPQARWGSKYGNTEAIDGLQKDGLQDAYSLKAMGISADQTAEQYQITRAEQDEFAIRSYRLAAESWKQGLFDKEVIKVNMEKSPGKQISLTMDEEFSKVKFEKIPLLKPAFSPTGTVTAANASTINDGAAALLLISGKKLKELGLIPLARIVSFSDAEQDPAWFTTTPAIAAPLALKRAGLTMDDISYFEVNEAFAVVAMVFNKILDLDPEKVNIRGGAVALGHPLGASGARILVSLAHILKDKNSRFGLAAICNGGGGASSVILENI